MLLVFGAQRYSNWRHGQPWGLLTDLFNGHVFELSGDSPVSIGRSAGAIRNMLDVPDSQHGVSRLHLFVSRGGVALDARSLHGTTINARHLLYGYEKKLEDGDVLALAGIAAYQFHAIRPPLLPSLWREERNSLPPEQGTWALLIDGKHRKIIALTKEEYFLSAGADGSLNLSDQKGAKTLLYIKMPIGTDHNMLVANLAQDRFLTATIKSDDRSYSSLRIRGPQEKKALQLVNGGLPQIGEYPSKVTFCFKQAEQRVVAVDMNPNDDLDCDVGPLQIVIWAH
jgi:hypothetical protein